MFIINVCGVDLYKTDNFLEFITKFKEYQKKFGIESVDVSSDSIPVISSLPELTVNLNVRFIHEKDKEI